MKKSQRVRRRDKLNNEELGHLGQSQGAMLEHRGCDWWCTEVGRFGIMDKWGAFKGHSKQGAKPEQDSENGMSISCQEETSRTE